MTENMMSSSCSNGGMMKEGDDSGTVPTGAQQQQPQSHTTPIFLTKTFDMMNKCDSSIAFWCDHGTAICVMDTERLTKEVFPLYFKHGNFLSFVRQLNFYGFRKIKTNSSVSGGTKHKASKVWKFRHAFFRQGRADLLVNIRKQHQVATTTTSTSLPSVSNDSESMSDVAEPDSPAVLLKSDADTQLNTALVIEELRHQVESLTKTVFGMAQEISDLKVAVATLTASSSRNAAEASSVPKAMVSRSPRSEARVAPSLPENDPQPKVSIVKAAPTHVTMDATRTESSLCNHDIVESFRPPDNMNKRTAMVEADHEPLPIWYHDTTNNSVSTTATSTVTVNRCTDVCDGNISDVSSTDSFPPCKRSKYEYWDGNSAQDGVGPVAAVQYKEDTSTAHGDYVQMNQHIRRGSCDSSTASLAGLDEMIWDCLVGDTNQNGVVPSSTRTSTASSSSTVYCSAQSYSHVNDNDSPQCFGYYHESTSTTHPNPFSSVTTAYYLDDTDTGGSTAAPQA